MPRPTRRLLPLLLLAAPARAQPRPLDLAALMARMATVAERRASFREEKRLAALDVPLVSTGRLHYQRPDRLEKFTEHPQEERLAVQGEQVVVETAAAGRKLFDLGQLPELRALVDAIRGPLAGDLAALERSFTLAASGTPEAWALVLTPKDERIGRFLREMRLRGAGTEVLETLSLQANGDELAMQIRPLP